MPGLHVYPFGVYRTESLLDGTATYAARHIVVTAEHPIDALRAALELAKRTDERACMGVGTLLYPHGRQAGVVWVLDLDGPAFVQQEIAAVAGKEARKKR